MITNNGKTVIKRYLANQGVLATTMVVGLGATAEALTDTKLAFETARFDVILTSYDYTANNLIFKGVLPEQYAGKIYEIGLFTLPANTEAGGFGSAVITSFDADNEQWLTAGATPVWTTTTARNTTTSLNQTPAASATVTSNLANLLIDLSGYSNADRFVFAYNVGNAFTSAIKFRFLTDSSNYYDLTLGAQTAGYKIVEMTKGSATTTGSPNWALINEVQVISTSTSGGASALDFDGIRIEDMDTVSSDYVMVSRKVMGTPVTKEKGKALEVEYALAVTV